MFYNRLDSCYYKIDKVKLDFLNGMFIMRIRKKLNYKMKFIDLLCVEILSIQILWKYILFLFILIYIYISLETIKLFISDMQVYFLRFAWMYLIVN